MKTLTQLAFAALIACSALATQAGPVRGYVRSNGTYVTPYSRSDAGSLGSSPSSGYVYRNPYAATPSVNLNGYYRSSGTYVAPHYRSNAGSLGSSPSSGYVYRNPYAGYPSVDVRGYYRSNGTYVAPHVRTPANNTVTDNLNYRGFGTVRVPKYSLGW
jgi:hypothetical protein